MWPISLTDDDVAVLTALTDDLATRFDTVESEKFQQEARVYADELPRSLRMAVNEFRLTEPAGLFVLSGLPVDDAAIGHTPADWRTRAGRSPTLAYDFAFYLVACLLGEPIGWATQQDGRIMHDIFPIREHIHEQIGWGSEELLTWHTEDAFHAMRTDYLGLMCLRNHDKVETTVADIAEVDLDEQTADLLFEERFHIVPDNSHRAQNQVESVDPDPRVAHLRQRSLDHVERELRAPTPVAVLFGSRESPYLRIDPYYMEDLHGGAEQEALARVVKAIDSAVHGVALGPGDICFIDNYRMVHGRKPFHARFDGTDRWLRRLNVTRDIRKSRALRLYAESRVIY